MRLEHLPHGVGHPRLESAVLGALSQLTRSRALVPGIPPGPLRRQRALGFRHRRDAYSNGAILPAQFIRVIRAVPYFAMVEEDVKQHEVEIAQATQNGDGLTRILFVEFEFSFGQCAGTVQHAMGTASLPRS